jgi:cation transport ATPase
VEQSLHQLPYLFQLSHDFEANMHACLAAAIVPSVLIIGGAYLKLVGIAGSLVIWTASMAAGLGIAGLSLLMHRRISRRLKPDERVSGPPVLRDPVAVN